MPIQKDVFINNFAQLSLDERISLFLGAGGSCDAGYPTWRSLFSPLAAELKTPVDDSTDYYKLAQYYANKFGSAELRKRINERINLYKSSSPLIDELLDVGFSNVWTTNFDNVIELNFQKRNVLTNKIFNDTDLSNVEINRRVNIFKVNGDISNLNGIIATKSDYESYADSHRLMLTFLKRELITSTFLFIGYSFTDNLILDCLGEISRQIGNSAGRHFTIMKDRPDDPYFKYFVDDLEKRYDLNVLLVKEYKDIVKILAELNQKIRSKKVFISGAFTSYEKDIEEFSHGFSKAVATKLLQNDYRIFNGIGSRFGTHLIGYANEFLAKQGVKNAERYLIVKPFVGNEKKSPQNKRRSRNNVIGQCGAAIFLFGENDKNAVTYKSGVWEEYDIACKQHKTIIPIAYGEMVSTEIWNEVKENITKFPYLEKCIDNLTYKTDIDKLTDTIIHILGSVRDL